MDGGGAVAAREQAQDHHRLLHAAIPKRGLGLLQQACRRCLGGSGLAPSSLLPCRPAARLDALSAVY